MSDLEDTSYYEIALTNRQVLVAFVIILVCMLTAFLSGVWVGRVGDGAGAPDPALAMQRDAAAQGPAVTEASPPEVAVDEDDESLEPLSFFGGSNGEAGDGASEDPAASQDNDSATATAPVLEERDPSPPRRGAAERGSSTGGGSDADDDESSSSEGGAPNTGAGRSPGAVPESSAPANPAVPRASARRSDEADGALFIQVFSTRDEVQARKVLKRLLDQSYGAFLSPVEVDGQTMFRVRLGPYDDRSDAESTAEDVRRKFRLDTWITAS